MRALFNVGPVATTALSTLLLLLLLVVLGTAEAQRPMYHVRPPANWINDPNGPYRDPLTGKLHLFMQYNPFDAVWGEMHWYHFTSDDYVTWQDKGIAVKNNNWYDHWGVYSGSITHNPDGTPVMMYTCVSDLDVQRQCIAVPPLGDIAGDNAPRTLNSWLKSPQNPVLTEDDVPNLVGLGNFRDPTNFWKNPDNESEWLVAFVARIKDKLGDHGHVVVFKTADRTWQSGFEYSHSLWHDEHDFHHMLECPDFFSLSGSHFMKVSTMISRQDVWVYGSYDKKGADNKTIYTEDPKRTPTYIDYGRWYASKQNYDPLLNRTILWGWVVEEMEESVPMRAQGWSGMMDMPRNVEYDEEAKKLKTYPMPELEALRRAPLVEKMSLSIADGKAAEVSAVAGRHYELVVDFELPAGAMKKGEYEPGKEPSFGVDVLRSADGETYTRIAVMTPSAAVVPKEDLDGRAYSVVSAKDATECAQKCENERRCVSWTGVQEKSYSCTLRSTIGTSKAVEETTTSGRTSEPVLLLDRAKSKTTGFTDQWIGRAPLLNGNKVQLRVFLDGTAVQVFKDGGRESLSARVYQGDKELTYVSLFASNIQGTVKAVATLYPMDTVYATGSEYPTMPEVRPPQMPEKSDAPVRCSTVLLLLAVLAQALL